MSYIKPPKQCSDLELGLILQGNSDNKAFPYSETERRFLNQVDYIKEQKFRNSASKDKSAENHQRLNALLKALHVDASIGACLGRAIFKSGKETIPIEVIGEHGILSEDKCFFRLLALGYFRKAFRECTKYTILATLDERVWLLPQTINASEWIQRRDGFAKLATLTRVYPKALNFFKLLGVDIDQSSDSCAGRVIEDDELLQEVVKILSVFPRYYTVEQAYRAEYAYGKDNRVMARSLANYPKRFIDFTGNEV